MMLTIFKTRHLLQKLTKASMSLIVYTIFTGASYAEDLNTVPFWAAQQGHWLSDNTYMDGKYNSKIAHYGTIFSISVDSTKATIVERKFYPPGHFPGSAVGLEIPESMGVQLMQISKAQPIDHPETAGAVKLSPVNSYMSGTDDIIQPVTETAAIFTSTNKQTKQLAYQMLITLPNPNSRIIVNLGLNQADKVYELGPLRGVSVFSAVRIEENEIDNKEKELRERYKTGVVITTNEEGKFITTWLDTQ